MRSISLLFFAIISVLFNQTIKAEALSGQWVSHPSFYQTPERMIDGENVLFLHLHQHDYNKSYKDYNKNTASLFFLDKTNPEKGIRAYSNEYSFFPTVIRALSYSPSQKKAIAAAEDFSLWVIPEQGLPQKAGVLLNNIIPGNQYINSITESADGYIWVGSTFGYAKVDIQKGEIIENVRTDYPAEWISQFGNNIVVFTSGSAYTFPASEKGSFIKNLTPLNISSSEEPALTNGSALKEPQHMMPLTQNSFAFLSSPDSGNRMLAVATVDGAKWNIRYIGKASFTEKADNQAITFPTSPNYSPTSGGFLLQAANSIFNLRKGIDPNSGETGEQYKGRILSSMTKDDETGNLCASSDSKTYYFFKPKTGFYSRTNNSGSWSAPSAVIYLDAPAPFVSNYMKWHPTLGMLVSNSGFDWNFSDITVAEPWLISAYKNGKWTQLSPVYFSHPEFDNNENYKKVYTSGIEEYPVSDPDGLAISEDDSRYAYAGSMYGGWARINLENPGELPMIIGNKNLKFYNTPGFINDVPDPSSWRTACDFSAPGFDNSGRLWFLFMDNDKRMESSGPVTLKWYEPDEVKANNSAVNNPGQFKPAHTLEFEVGEMMMAAQQFLVLKNEKNKNFFVLEMSQYNCPIYIYDHNGTPGDTSDDRLAVIHRPQDAVDGSSILVGSPARLWEDTSTGKVWMSHGQGSFVIDPVMAFEDPSKACEFVRIDEDGDGECEKKLFQTSLAVNGAVDALGNLWIATNGSGLWCLSPDRKKVLGEMTVTNSAIPSNKLYGVCYNPDSNSIMVSSAEGYAEFFPELLGAVNTERISMAPSSITPLFRGTVSFSGLPSGTYAIENVNGDTVISLGSPKDGTILWDASDSNGNRLSTGTYRLKQLSGGNATIEFKVLK